MLGLINTNPIGYVVVNCGYKLGLVMFDVLYTFPHS